MLSHVLIKATKHDQKSHQDGCALVRATGARDSLQLDSSCRDSHTYFGADAWLRDGSRIAHGAFA
jgi:hypothetical protein